MQGDSGSSKRKNAKAVPSIVVSRWVNETPYDPKLVTTLPLGRNARRDQLVEERAQLCRL
jgi:hypothetical protein